MEGTPVDTWAGGPARLWFVLLWRGVVLTFVEVAVSSARRRLGICLRTEVIGIRGRVSSSASPFVVASGTVQKKRGS